MNYQYYKTLMDKSEENLFFLIEKIVPAPLKEELGLFLEGFNLGKIKKSSLEENFIQINPLNKNYADLSKLNSQQLKEIYETFISREKNDKKAVKWRLLRYLRIQKDIQLETLHINVDMNEDNAVDIIFETKNHKYYFINCSYILEKEYYYNLIEKLIAFSKKINLKPEKIVFSAHKTYRDIPYKEDIQVGNIKYEIEKEIWVEWTELEKPFNGEDLLLILSNNEKDLELAGFNFTSIQTLLDYVYRYSKGGQIAIYKQPGFFSAKSNENPQIELIWKGIMLKNKI
ncbi:MAG: hypothetical protein EU541_00185 [Promethearchaeota archaeon]|nr:MAG: hypothetical protein EU541_00185 [Candidatus Lokiarchaeota archaeon]